jgi:hypothetical protein
MASQALTHPRGDTIPIRLTITRPDSNDVQQPVNLTGAVLRATFKRDPADADPGVKQLGTDTTPAQFTISVPASAGIAVLQLLPADTASLTAPVTLYWDVQMLESGGALTTVAEGTLKLTADITRATS